MEKGNAFIRFLKDWTLPVAIGLGTVCYLVFSRVPALAGAADFFGPVFDLLFPVTLFLTLFVTFCKVDFHEMRPHCWHVGVLVAQLLLVAVNIGVIFWTKSLLNLQSSAPSPLSSFLSPLLWEAVLTCIIGPSAVAAPVVVGKLYFACLADVLDVRRIHRSDDGLHLCRVAEDPCDRDRSLGDVLSFADLRKRLVELGEIRIVDERTSEHAELER